MQLLKVGFTYICDWLNQSRGEVQILMLNTTKSGPSG